MLLVLALAAACAEVYGDSSARPHSQKDRSIRAIATPSLPHGCLYEGRWFTESAEVTTQEACLRCVCARGALACRRRACAVLPDPPPKRCHVLHRKGACCPELHCPNSVTLMEHGASARFENDDFSDIVTPASIVHACVEGGTVYSGGSAMASSTACEQCFCLRGARRCVRPRCLRAPPACRARPAPGACCPLRYYCDHVTTTPPDLHRLHDCEVKGTWVPEGERVVAKESSNCTRCFCLRGSVLCQPLACAPPLLGCKPLLRPGQCCPHQYHCDHNQQGVDTPHLHIVSDNVLISTRSNDRSFHPSKLNEVETSTKAVTISANTTKSSPTTLQHVTKTSTISTTKVKRKTNDPPPATSNNKPVKNSTTTTKVLKLTTQKPKSTIAITTRVEEVTTEEPAERTSTEQPEGTMKIMINGTINCTAELSSTSIPMNISANDTEKIMMESMPRIPDVDRMDVETQTSYPNDIITDRNVNGGFDENESFVINVTSSLRTNTSLTTSPPALSTFSKVSISEVLSETNNSKKTKGDYDYDYTEPTLPPSLPNLKIIPFVAADAVVDDDVSSKESMSYPILEREDKFPVYYPAVESKESPYATRREDKYPPTQYPVFVSEKMDLYPTASLDIDLPNSAYPTGQNDLLTSLQEYAVAASLGNHNLELKNRKVTTKPSTSSTFAIKTPAVNLFSPPVETEGGFVPKGPGIIDEYYAVYPSTKTPSVPHLTTSMQLDISKEPECAANDARSRAACARCACTWAAHCDLLCCEELICDMDKNTNLLNLSSTEEAFNTTKKPEDKTNIKTTTASINKTEIINKTTINTGLKIVVNETENNITFANNNDTKVEHSSMIPNVTENIFIVSTTANTIVTTTKHSSTEAYETKHGSQEYEEEDEDDDGYFFGNVLKYILSDNYDTTVTPFKKKTSPPVTKASDIIKPSMKPQTTTTTTIKPTPQPTIAPFVPMPHHHHVPYAPPKKTFQQNTVNRIDHLVLGEPTAIKSSTPRPVTTSFKPKISSYKPHSTSRITTQRPVATTRFTEIPKKTEPTVQYTPAEIFRQPPSGVPGLGPGLLKLAGCNIYGRMYRVGRIIAELSTPCQECWCTEIGVQCKQLAC
ncbi:mucin-2-like [Plodia interpunctella]|uniref:mucin-2-like n=1 Tax=Plodia interpunctella TaxID=58824 RepID=UPI0023685F9B|nr:probable maltase-glucoamylase 2 [Plodia interpunctella]